MRVYEGMWRVYGGYEGIMSEWKVHEGINKVNKEGV